MATAKTKMIEQPVEDITDNNTNITAEENNELKKQIEEMKATIELLQKQYDNNNSTVADNKPTNKMIPFVNMTNGIIVLKGSQIYTIEEQFGSRSFTEKEAEIILTKMNKCIRSGLVYICDANFVQEHSLADAYVNILSVDTLKNLFNKDYKYIVESYKIATNEQRGIIIDMIAERLMNSIPVDGNVIVEISKLSGKDLTKIEPED